MLSRETCRITKGDETKVWTRNGRSASKVLSYMNYDNFQYIRQVEHMYMYTPFSVIHVSEMYRERVGEHVLNCSMLSRPYLVTLYWPYLFMSFS